MSPKLGYSAELLRIASNYASLAITFVCGILILRVALSLGQDLFAIFVLVTVGVGLTPILNQLLRMTFQTPLGFAFEDGESADGFPKLFNAAQAISIISAFVGIAIMFLVGVYAAFQASDAQNAAAIWALVIGRSINLFLFVALMPMISMLLVTGRQLQDNLLTSYLRVAEAAAIAIPYYLWGLTGAPLLELFAITAAVLQSGAYFAAIFYIRRFDSRIRLSPEYLDWSHVRLLTGKLKSAFLVVFSMNLYIRYYLFFASIMLGPTAVAILGIAVQLTGYCRQMMMGLVRGLDAVFNRLYRIRDADRKVDPTAFLAFASSMQASLSFMAISFFFFTADYLVFLLVDGKVEDPGIMAMQTGGLIQLMTLGMAARNLTEGWRNAMIGAGHLIKLPAALLPGALLNPLLLYGVFTIMRGDGEELYSIAISYALILTFVHFPLMWLTTKRHLSLNGAAMLAPFAIPALLSLIAFTVIYTATLLWQIEGFALLLTTVGICAFFLGLMVLRDLLLLKANVFKHAPL